MTDHPKHDSVAPQTDQTKHIEPLHGADRSGLGEKGWAEVSDDLIGGHPELETVPDAGVGGLNGPQPETDPATGAAGADEEKKPR
jgi:hypothetical protein